MVDNNKTQSQINQQENNEGINKIKYDPNYSIMYLYDADLARVIMENLKRALGPQAAPSVAGILVKPTSQKDAKGCPIEILAYFNPRSPIFENKINPNIARLINVEEEYKVSEAAKQKLSYFLAKTDKYIIKQYDMGKKGSTKLITLTLNPYLTLSNMLLIPEGTVIDIPEVKQVSKNNCVITIRNYKKPEPKKKKNNNNRRG